MKIKNQLAFALSTLLLSVGVATVKAQPSAPTTRPTSATSPKPSAKTPLSLLERQELEQRREKDRVERFVEESVKDSPEVRAHVQEEVNREINRAFGFTTSLVNFLLFLLILFPIAGIISLWLLRRSLAAQIENDLKKEVVPKLKAEIVKVVRAELPSVRNLPKPQETNGNGENVAQLKELITMTMATQNVITEARSTIEESLKAQTKTGDLLKDVFTRTEKQGEIFEERAKPAEVVVEPAIKHKPSEAIEPAIKHKPAEPFVEHHSKPVEVVVEHQSRPVEVVVERQSKPVEVVVEHQVKQGKDFFLEGRYEDALTVYEKAIQAHPEAYDAWCNKGVALTKMKRYEEAIAGFNQALRLNSEYAEAWYEKARCYALQGNDDSAVENLRQAINLNPSKRLIARNESDFNLIRDNEWFESLVAG